MIEFHCLSKDRVVQQYSRDASYVLNGILGPKDRAVDETKPPTLRMELAFQRRQTDDE